MASKEKHYCLALWLIANLCCISGLEDVYSGQILSSSWSTPGEISHSESTQSLLLDIDTKSLIEDFNENTNSTAIDALWVANTTLLFNISPNTTDREKVNCIHELRRSNLKRQYTNVKLACVPFLTVVGITGNILSFIVMGSAVYSRKSYSFYLRALAIFDSLTLITECILVGNELSHELGSAGFLEGHSLFTCKLTNFLESVVYLMSSWLVVAFTFDRYIAVCHPLQRARLCTETRAKVTILVLLVMAMASQAFRFYYIERLEDRHQPCHAAKEFRLQYFGVHYLWFSFTLRFALPFLAIVVCNGLIIFHVRRMSKIRQTEERDKKRRANLAITTLVVICAVFILTLVPNALIALVQYLKGRHKPTYCVLYKLDTPFQMIRLLNYSTNFLLYGLTGRLFRCELRRLLSCRRCRRRGRGASPSFAYRNRNGLKVNFRSVQKRLPAMGGAGNGTPCQRLVGTGSRDRKFFLAGQIESKL